MDWDKTTHLLDHLTEKHPGVDFIYAFHQKDDAIVCKICQEEIIKLKKVVNIDVEIISRLEEDEKWR